MLSITKKLETLTDEELLILSKAINQELVSREEGEGENPTFRKRPQGKKTPIRGPHLENGRKGKR